MSDPRDLVEDLERQLQGVTRPFTEIGEARWTFCLALANAKEFGISLASIKTISFKMKYLFSESQISEAMDYLVGLGLCEREEAEVGTWFTQTPRLSELMERKIPCPPGVAQPEAQWWGFDADILV